MSNRNALHKLTKIARKIGHSDKATSHIYTEFYGPFLNPRRLDVKRMLEVGISDGGSIAMWHEFFPNAQIYGVDKEKKDSELVEKLKKEDRVHLFFEDAYKRKFINKLKGLKFDVILDDGRHDMVAWSAFLKMYPALLAKDGVLMIEDVFSIDHAEALIEGFKGDKDRLSIIDRRTIPGAYRRTVTFTYENGVEQTHFVTNEIVLLYM
jgi:predicted O-methyltransferase YrrM